jgi:hypothetical protein
LQLLAIKGRKHWLVSLICSDPSQASGACHRSLQLLHLLGEDGWQLQPLEATPPPGRRLATLRSGLEAGLRHGPVQPFGIESLRSQGHCAQDVANLHSRFPSLAGVIQEGTGYGSLCAVAEWRRRGVRTVLVPANIEALAPNTGSWTHRNHDVSQRFAHERRWWAMADAIFTISIEEAWWLQLHGICAEWMPYYPAPQREQQLLTIRKQRKPNAAVGWLWLADFRNPANQAGVPLTLKWLKSISSQPQQIQIAGRGMSWLEQMFGDQLPSNTRLIGERTDEQLEDLYRHCIAQLIVHPATSGMLTRVIDAAIANIPIVGNSMATKSYAACFNHNSVVAEPTRAHAAEVLFLGKLNC